MAAGNMEEYLVKLGVQLDSGNMAKLMNFLSSSKVQAAMLSGALIAAGKVIYNFIRDNTQMEQSLEQTAKAQKKSVEQVRAHENALKAMGKTADEIKKNSSLKSIYNDLIKINKEMALPNMKGALNMVYKLQGEFYALRSTVQYGLQWINYYILKDLAGPIREITKQLRQARKYLQENIKSISRRISLYISTFARGLLGIVGVARTLIQWFNQLPDGIKSATTAILAMFAVLKSGPLGQILMMVEAIGGLIHDYENYQYNKKAGVTGEVAKQLYDPKNGYFGKNGYLTKKGQNFLKKQGIDPKNIVNTAFNGIWDVLDNPDQPLPEKITSIADLIAKSLVPDAQKLADEVTKWINENRDTITGAFESLGEVVTSAVLGAGEIAGAIVKGAEDIITNQELLTSIGKALGALFTTVGKTTNDIGNAIMGAIGTALSGASEKDWKSSFANNQWTGALGAALAAYVFSGENAKTALATGLVSLLGDALKPDEEGKIKGIRGDELTEAAKGIGGLLIDGLYTASNLGGDIIKAIGTSLVTAAVGEGGEKAWSDAIGDDNVWLNGLATAIVAAMSGGNFAVSLIAGIGTALVDASKDDKGTAKKALGDLTALATAMGPVLRDAFINATNIAGDIVSGIGTAITRAFKGENAPSWDDALGSDNVWLEGLGIAIGGKIGLNLSIGQSLLLGLISALGKAKTSDEGISKALKDLKPIGSEIWNNIVSGFNSLKAWWDGEDGIAFRKELEQIGNDVADTLFGKKDEKTGERAGGLFDDIKKMWDDIKNSELFQEITKQITDAVQSAMDALWGIIEPKVNEIWANILAGMPQRFKDWLGIKDKTTVTENEDGTQTYKSTDGGEVTVDNKPDEQGLTVNDVLTQHGITDVQGNRNFMGVDLQGAGFVVPGLNEFGNAETSNSPNAQMVMDGTRNKFLGLLSTAASSGDARQLNYLLDQFSNFNKAYTTGSGQDKRKAVSDFWNFTKNFNGTPEDYTPTITVESNAEDATKGLNDTKAAAEGLNGTNATVTVTTNYVTNGEPSSGVGTGPGPKRKKNIDGTASKESMEGHHALGGRFDRPTVGEFGEDGTEYIVPITKPERAFPLIVQMLSEMGSAATKKVMDLMGLNGGSGTIGGSLGSLGSLGGNNITINNNVSAPVNIYVQGAGKNSQEIGTTAYNTAVRYWMRTVQGVLA